MEILVRGRALLSRLVVFFAVTAVGLAWMGPAHALQAFPTIQTSPNPSAVTLGTGTTTLFDSALLTGGNSPTGTVTFTLVGPDGVTVLDTETGTVVNGGASTPTGFTLPTTGTAAGTYHWNAAYSGDANNASVSETGEQVKVSQAQPFISTSAVTPRGGQLGTTAMTLNDSATLTGGYFPTGTITFTLSYSSTTVDTETVSVNGNGTYTTPTGFTLPTTGTVTGSYQWFASYSGDANNTLAIDVSQPQNEQAMVSPALPAISTTAGGGATLGTTPPTLTDSAVLSNGYFPTGAITFTLFGPGGSIFTQTVSVNGNGTYTAAIPLVTSGTVAGSYQWSAMYNGDHNNQTASGANNDPAEQATVSPNSSPSIVTTPSATTASPNDTMKDSATVSGYFPTGSVLFQLFDPSNHIVDSESVTLNNGTATTPTGYFVQPAFGPPANIPGSPFGTYQWDAFYSSDANNAAVSETSSANEQVVVKDLPKLGTTPSPASVTLGAAAPPTLTDSAVLSGGSSPTGTLTFTLLDPSSAVRDTETVTVSGAGTYSTPVGFTLPTNSSVAGTWQWNVTYSGDANNFAVSENNNAAEQVAVSKAGPAIATTAIPTAGTTGSVLNDSAAISGGYFPTGTITFTLRSPANAVVDTESVAVNGNGTYSTPVGYIATGPGTYQWTATYSGDGNNDAVASTLGAEPVSITGPACGLVLTGQQSRSRVVGSGPTVCLFDATVPGALRVRPGGTVVLSQSLIQGAFTASHAATVTVCGSMVQGGVGVSRTSGFVLLGDPGDDACAGNQFDSSVSLRSNEGAVEVDHNTIGSSLTVIGNTGTGVYPEDQGAEIGDNTVHARLACAHNIPIGDDGQTNSVAGARSGQCSGATF